MHLIFVSYSYILKCVTVIVIQCFTCLVGWFVLGFLKYGSFAYPWFIPSLKSVQIL